MKDLKKLILILVFAFCVISSFMFQNNYASCEDLTFTLNTNGYESGTWTHENVTVEIVYNGTDDVTYQYAINNYETGKSLMEKLNFHKREFILYILVLQPNNPFP